MPSPFPGMDPFIEGQRWQDFHARFIMTMSERLLEQVRPLYVVNVEEYVYLTREATNEQVLVRPDVSVAKSAESWAGRDTANATTAESVVLTVPMAEHFEQHYIVIRRRKRHQVVTVIELLSPWNKTSDGQAEYLLKRNNIFGTHAHLLELDLLRGGKRLPTVESLPQADHYAFLCRAERLPHVEVFGWRIQQPLPTVPVPLAGDDPDAVLDLQGIFTTVYDRGGYDYALDYDVSEMSPQLTSDDEAWAEGVLRSQKPDG